MLAALEWLQSTKAANPRVWGIDEEIARLEAIRDKAAACKAEAESLLADDQASTAYPYLKKALSIVADDPEVDELKSLAKSRIVRGRQEHQEAIKACRAGKDSIARTHAETAARSDATDKHVALVVEIKRDMVRTRRASKNHKIGIAATFAAGVGFVALTAALAWWSMDASDVEARQVAIVSAASNLMYQAQASVSKEDYPTAKTKLDMAVQQLEGLDRPDADRLREEIRDALASEAVVEGNQGKVPLDDRWVTPDERTRELADRKQLQQNVDELDDLIGRFLSGRIKTVVDLKDTEIAAVKNLRSELQAIEGNIRAKRFDEAQAAYSELVKRCESQFRRSDLVKYENTWMTRAAAKESEMIVRGFVKHEGEWVTPEEKERLVMTAKGMVQFDGQWVTPERRDELKMLAKGLVKYKDEWVTSAEKERREMTDKGLVQYEGEWVTPFDRDNRIREKKQEMAPKAYLISQKFVRSRLKAPLKAKFPDYRDNDVKVTLRDDGHYVIQAYVDAQNSFGTYLRSKYIVELWPLDEAGERWQRGDPVEFEN